MSCLLGCPVMDRTVLTIYNSIFNSQWVKFPLVGIMCYRTCKLHTQQTNNKTKCDILGGYCEAVVTCALKKDVCVSKRDRATVVYFLFTPHITVTYTHNDFLYIFIEEILFAIKTAEREQQTVSHNLIFINLIACYMFWLFGKATIRQLKIHEYSFNTAGCSVEGVG